MPDDRGEEAVWFFRTQLRHTKGKFAGRPFDPLPWQEKLLRDIFGTVDSKGHRIVQESYVEVPKKNGKTELAAGIALFMLFMDDEPGAEIYSCASKREQAAICFKVAESMIRRNPDLLDQVNITKSSKLITLKDDDTCLYKAISADGGLEDGINPHGVIFDELHRQKNRDLWSITDFGGDARDQPLVFAITTAGVSGESELCWEQHERARQQIEGLTRDPSFYPVIYGAGKDEDWTDPAVWKRANPSLEGNPGGFMSLPRVERACAKAQASPLQENQFRRFRLNQWVEQESRWISLEAWDQCGEPFNCADLIGKPCYGGLDLSTTLDITAFVLAFPEEDLLKLLAWFWLPGKGIETRDPRALGTWAKADLIETTEGDVIDYGAVRRKINELGDVYTIQEIGHDPWNATQLALDLAGDGFELVPIRQGYGSMSPPSKEFEERVISQRIRHGGNPVLRWMMDCASVKQDTSGNIKPAKPERLKSTKRIDGIVASIMALDRAVRHEGPGAIDASDLIIA